MNVESIVTRKLVMISVDSIREEVVQLRSEYNEGSLTELVDSVEGDGILQPVVVAVANDDSNQYELIIGSRRLRAAKRRDMWEIPAIVIEQRSPLNYLLMALAENLHRQDLNPFEEGRAFLRLMKDYGLGTAEVSKQTGKSENYVRIRMELLSMPDEVQSMVAEKTIGLQFISPLARLPTGKEQVHFANKAVSDRLTLTEFQTLVRREREEPSRSHEHQHKNKFSAEKVRIKMDMFTSWLGTLPNKTVVKQMNSEERVAILRALIELEMQTRLARALFSGGAVKINDQLTPSSAKTSTSNLLDVRNSHSEWPAADIRRITATNRPSDEVLSLELGRTVTAIRSMRSSAQRRKIG